MRSNKEHYFAVEFLDCNSDLVTAGARFDFLHLLRISRLMVLRASYPFSGKSIICIEYVFLSENANHTFLETI